MIHGKWNRIALPLLLAFLFRFLLGHDITSLRMGSIQFLNWVGNEVDKCTRAVVIGFFAAEAPGLEIPALEFFV